MKPNHISLYCPKDSKRVNRYFISKHAPDNGHPTRYCNSGIMGLPIHNNSFVDMAVNAMFHMVKQYDFVYSVADQDVVNRMVGENYNNGGGDDDDDNNYDDDTVFDFISCQWACDVNSW